MSTTTKNLAGKVAVVTGASKGIGAAIARHLAAEGAAVVVNYASSKEGADHVVAQIAGQGGKAVAVQANVAKKADIDLLFVATKKAFGELDILVNNAGIYEFSPLEGITEEHFHKQFNLNVLGLLLTTQEAVKHFGPGGGSIINISSSASTLAPPNTSVYSATKGAVDALTRSLMADALAKHSDTNWYAPFLIEAFSGDNYPVVRYFAANGLAAANANIAKPDYLGDADTRGTQIALWAAQVDPAKLAEARHMADTLRKNRSDVDLEVGE